MPRKWERAKVIDELRHKYSLKLILGFDGMSRSTFYYQLKRMKKPDHYQELKEEIIQIFEDNKKCYGYRRITLELKNRGYKVNHKVVQKLMRQCGLKCVTRKRNKYNSYKGNIGKTAPNIIARDFVADSPNKKWATDVTEFVTTKGDKVYLSPILDMFNGEIVSYNISLHPNFNQTMDMLDKAFKRVPNTQGVILHSDQGWQYQMKQYQVLLEKHGIIQSMSRKGNCLDNSIMESFFGILKTEIYLGEKYNTIEKLVDAINEYIHYYHNKRIKLRLNGLSPIQYRLKFCNTVYLPCPKNGVQFKMEGHSTVVNTAKGVVDYAGVLLFKVIYSNLMLDRGRYFA
ncbi:IS3 family transposase [Anaerovibrio sp.]|uniref:IS3 family transposase n=1 Tax=Anaerovibrio sp. TaxID=1872532 RepID=UPI0025BD5A38|nr:IS3 family transposase [Anaerovibrio sp.]